VHGAAAFLSFVFSPVPNFAAYPPRPFDAAAACQRMSAAAHHSHRSLDGEAFIRSGAMPRSACEACSTSSFL